MNKKICFIGNEELRNNLESSLQLIGWEITEFIGWDVDNLIVYQLEKVDIPSFHIPENLLIITNNIKLKNFNNTNIFYYQMSNLKFTFSRFILDYVQRITSKPSDFYDNKEIVNLLYNQQTIDLEYLRASISKNNRHILNMMKYSEYLSEQPIKTILYMEAPEKPMIMKNDILTIYKGYNSLQKKELKSQNPLAPKLFINKINKTTIKKILKII